MKKLLLISFILIGMIWIGCQKEDNRPEPEPDYGVRIKSEKVVTFIKRDTVFRKLYEYNEDGTLRYIKIYDQDSNFSKVYNYTNGKLMSWWFTQFGNKKFYEHRDSVVLVHAIHREFLDTVSTTLCYLDENNYVLKSILKGSIDTTYYYWDNNNLTYTNDSNGDDNTFYIYSDNIKNPYKFMYESVKMNGNASDDFYIKGYFNADYKTEKEVIETINIGGDIYPSEYTEYDSISAKLIFYIKYK